MLTVAVMVLPTAVPATDVSLDEFPFRKELRRESEPAHEIGAVLVDEEVYAGTDDGFGNMRLFTADGQTVPFHVRPVTGTDTSRSTRPVNLERMSVRTMWLKHMTITFKRDSTDSVPDQLTIHTPNVNFDKTVAVSGSDDGKQWEALGEPEPIFDYSKFIDVRSTSVQFEKKPFKYYRVVIDTMVEIKRSPFTRIVRGSSGSRRDEYEDFIQVQEALRIDRVAFARTVSRVHQGRTEKGLYDLEVVRTTVDTTRKVTEVLLHSGRTPLWKLDFETDDVNFRRTVAVHAAEDTSEDAAWCCAASGELYRISAGDFSREDLEVRLGGVQRHTWYRLTITDQDNPPIGISGCTGEGQQHELLFFHRNAAELSLYYGGGETVPTPRYDVASVLSAAPPVECERWIAGPEIATGAQPTAAVSLRWLLITVLVVMVVVLGWLVVGTARKVDEEVSE